MVHHVQNKTNKHMLYGKKQTNKHMLYGTKQDKQTHALWYKTRQTNTCFMVQNKTNKHMRYGITWFNMSFTTNSYKIIVLLKFYIDT